jgi:methylamine utilization protein MauE
MQLDPLVILIACGVLIAVFVRAVWHKLSDFDVFKASFADYEILPQSLINPAALILVLAEAAIVMGLVIPLTRPAAAIGAMLLLVTYGGAIAVNLRRGRYMIDCGCGGPGQGLSWFLVARNAILAVIAAMAAAAPATRDISFSDALILAMSVITVWLVILASEQVAANDAHRQFIRNSRNKG